MDRLEMLVDMLALRQWDEVPAHGRRRPANVRRGEAGGDDPVLGSD